MNLFQCKIYAEDYPGERMFEIDLPSGKAKCKWKDPFFGLIEIEGVSGFVRDRDLEAEYPGLECSIIREGKTNG